MTIEEGLIELQRSIAEGLETQRQQDPVALALHTQRLNELASVADDFRLDYEIAQGMIGNPPSASATMAIFAGLAVAAAGRDPEWGGRLVAMVATGPGFESQIEGLLSGVVS